MRDYFGNLPIVDGMGFSRGIKVLDNCEGTMTWIVSGTGGDDVHEFATAAAWEGEKGLRLKTRVTGTAADDDTTVGKYFDYPESGLLVARLRFSPLIVANTKAFYVYLNIDDGAQQYSSAIKLLISTATVSYLNSAGTYTAIAALATTFLANQWYTVELAIDCRAKKYIHVRFNGFESDLSAQGLYNSAVSSSRGALLWLTNIASAAGASEIYADNIYVGEFVDA